MSTQPSYSDWVWSPEHRRHYCYRYDDAGRAEYMWSDAAQAPTRPSGRGAPNPAAPSTLADYDDGAYLEPTPSSSNSSRRREEERGPDEQGRAMLQRRDTQQASAEEERLRRGSAEDVRRFQDGDEVSMAVEDRGQLVRASFVVRRGKLDRQGRWEYQLWHENGTAHDGGHWFREAELA
ncbi:hypothetical protein GTA08_BOTSDO12135 [Neofusicoccum parvum]|uniref:Uncharacterized protein n=1 Tax=Botryosphaeria parva (strain UCR-NP2) TaxID=1287680 RepID=R1EY90_BOTPV|nr:hypothetical protein UCRNP2_638 [Neofusicoccum parvum UCRNP2]GME37835.1 hypothetical protein GTA08_BOTSDO12135 [Neofusicoccum parvum]